MNAQETTAIFCLVLYGASSALSRPELPAVWLGRYFPYVTTVQFDEFRSPNGACITFPFAVVDKDRLPRALWLTTHKIAASERQGLFVPSPHQPPTAHATHIVLD